MGQGIREALVEDAPAVATFFKDVFEGHHGIGSADAVEMLQRTVAVLFPPIEPVPAVFMYEQADNIIGVAAVRPPGESGICELVTVQVFDNVQGRGVAQTLLQRVLERSREWHGSTIATEVLHGDVRARGFLRREGFVADAEPDGALPGPTSVVRYARAVTPAAF